MIFHIFTVPGLAINTYLIGDEDTKRCAVIDPVRDTEQVIKFIESQGLTVSAIMETHVHADFISGAKQLKNLCGESPIIYCSAMGGTEWIPEYTDREVQDGDEVQVGNIKLQAMHTPGHTPEHVCWLVFDTWRSEDTPCMMFSGDLLFVGSVGRPDLLGEEEAQRLAEQLHNTLFAKIADIPDFVEIYPAHGAGSACGKNIGSRQHSTMGYERRFNPSLAMKEKSQWIQDLLSDMPAAPHYFSVLKKMNLTGAPLDHELEKSPEQLSLQEIQKNAQEHLVIDTRREIEFTDLHIPGSICIPLGDLFSKWAGWLVPYEKPFDIILRDESWLPKALSHLRSVGLDNLRGYFICNPKTLTEIEQELTSIPELSPEEVRDMLDHPDDAIVIDVRTSPEWNGGHIKDALNVELGLLSQNLGIVPKDKNLVVTCATGFRGTMGASILKRAHFENVSVLKGGMNSWREKRLPIVK